MILKWEKLPQLQNQKLLREFPLREAHGGNFVHVPWSRADLHAFTTNFPKLKGEPEKWYKEVQRLATISQMRRIDFDLLFEIVVPSDLRA